jgi:hypothetical protein
MFEMLTFLIISAAAKLAMPQYKRTVSIVKDDFWGSVYESMRRTPEPDKSATRPLRGSAMLASTEMKVPGQRFENRQFLSWRLELVSLASTDQACLF